LFKRKITNNTPIAMQQSQASSSSSSNNKRTISKEEWDKRCSQVKIQKSDLNKLVMNYLVVEGYKDAAEAFAKEAHTPSTYTTLIRKLFIVHAALC